MALAQQEVSREELKRLQSEKAEALQRLKAIENAETGVADDLGALERDLIAAAMESQRREEQATSAELRLLSLRTRLASARQDLSLGEATLESLTASLALSGRHRPPALLTRPDDANAAIRTAILMGEITPAVKAKTDLLSDEIATLRRLEQQVVRESLRLETAEAALALKQAQILQLTTAKRAAFEDVTADAEALRQRVEALGQKEESLRSLILALEKAAPPAPRVKPTLRLAETQPERRAPAASAAPRATVSQPLGVLANPASGRMIRRWGDKLPGGTNSEGVSFATRSGAQVTSPIDGKVEWAGPWRSYGQLLILSTSDGYHVLLSGMASSYVTVGQEVRQGEPVARMVDRETGEPELYMEVRQDGKPMNPAKWMKRG